MEVTGGSYSSEKTNPLQLSTIDIHCTFIERCIPPERIRARILQNYILGPSMEGDED